MKNHIKALAIVMIMALLLATAAVPLLAASGPGGKDNGDDKSDKTSESSNSGSGSPGGGSGSESSGSNSGSGTSGSNEDDKRKSDSSASDKSRNDATGKTGDKLEADISAKDGELKIEVRAGQDRLKAEAKEGNDGQDREVKTEARGGFAGFLSRLIGSILGRGEKASSEAANSGNSGGEAAEKSGQSSEAAQDKENKAATPAPGITIDKTLSSGPGYPTGPLDLSVPAAQLILDRVGQVKGGEIKDRQYEVEFAAVPVTINGASYTATEVKVISNLKTKAGAGQHQGTIDVDIDVPLGSTLPAGHITLEYKGSAIVSGSTISSGGVFKTSKMTGVFAGLVSEGTYSMTIIESGSTFGAPATVSITTTSTA